MPELPEVETVRRVMERALVGQKIKSVTVNEDAIIFSKTPREAIIKALEGAKVTAIGRKGKTWWIELDRKPWLYGHLGMSGWIRELGQPTVRLKEHGNAPLDDANGVPKFLKLMIETEKGNRIAFTDARRLGRAWLSDEKDEKVRKLGPDALHAMPSVAELSADLAKRKAPIKATLMDQTWVSGIGNWVADEVLYHARIAPQRLGNTLSEAEIKKLRTVILDVLKIAVDAGADHDRYPEDWMFHARWGGARGKSMIGNHELKRESVAGRTTAWVPDLQK